jgi:hypothetical protein
VERQLVDIETAEATSQAQIPNTPPGSGPAVGGNARRDEPKQSAHPTPAWLDSLVKE